MKLSLNWIKQYTDVDVSVDELVAKIGAQLGEVESVENLAPKYAKTVIVKVISCDKHPNADRLNVCIIDDGGITPDVNRLENGLVQVVCGAPNVTAGVTVVWLPPGATVPDSYDKDPFVLSARELRGVVSNGMLASPKELALGDSHDGLLLLDDDKQPGTMFADAFGLNDTIIDIENKMFTHRPDLFGELGLAREVAGITGRQFSSPDWYSALHDAGIDKGEALALEVQNELPTLVPRFMAVALSDIEIKPSPMWLQSYLSRMGIRSINNVVDITNYIMLLTAQPLHAYDYDKVRERSGGDAAVLCARNPRDNERLRLLNDKEIDPRQDGIMIATDTQLIGAAGVMGGADTEVDENTKNIILEIATFDMYSVRKTSMAHGLFTDAVTRFNKGQSPLQNPYVMQYALQLLAELAGAKQASDVIDNNQVAGREWVHPPVPVTTAFVNERLGLDLSAQEMQRLLENVEFHISEDGETMTVTAPFWRTDIETREDIVEEVGRLYGFDKLPLDLPMRSAKPATKDQVLTLKSSVREVLTTSGATEVLTYSFVHGNLLERVGQKPEEAFRVGNALSPDLQYYRLSLTPSLLDKVHMNIKAGYDEFALYELGKTHEQSLTDEHGLPAEHDNLAFVYASRSNKAGAAYYTARLYLDSLLQAFGHELELTPLDQHTHSLDAPFDVNRLAAIKLKGAEETVGVIGEYAPSVRKSLKLPQHSAGFEFNVAALLRPSSAEKYQPLPRFPKVLQDITLRVSKGVSFAALQGAVQDSLRAHQPEQTRVQLLPVSVYQKDGDDDYCQVTFRVSVANHQKTLTDTEVNALLDHVAGDAGTHLQAERV
jgi:phenylalanyl-tRNA synthetase beta chain